MKHTQVNLQGIRPYSQGFARVADRRAAIQELFVELIRVLETLKASPQATSADDIVERWEDENFIYLQSDLGAVFDTEIDINVHDGQFHVRLER